MAVRTFHSIAVRGVAAAVPGYTRNNELIEGEQKEIDKLAKLVGVKNRYITTPELCSSDLCYAAAENLLAELAWDKNSVDALIFLSQTPDYILPATSCVLQSRLNLSVNCAAFDMSLGCSGYIYGLLTAYSLISEKGIKRVLLLVGDTISKLISPHDMPANILFGDAGSATAIEFDSTTGSSYFSVGTDGRGAASLIVEAGGFRKESNDETKRRTHHQKDNVLRSKDELFMDGSAVFSFTLTRVPILVNELMQLAGKKVADMDCWLFHQANKFMLDYLGEKVGIDPSKIPSNMEEFGNTSPPSIPLLMVTHSKELNLMQTSKSLGLLGFGVGLSWGGALITTDNLVVPELIYVTNEEQAHAISN